MILSRFLLFENMKVKADKKFGAFTHSPVTEWKCGSWKVNAFYKHRAWKDIGGFTNHTYINRCSFEYKWMVLSFALENPPSYTIMYKVPKISERMNDKPTFQSWKHRKSPISDDTNEGTKQNGAFILGCPKPDKLIF